MQYTTLTFDHCDPDLKEWGKAGWCVVSVIVIKQDVSYEDGLGMPTIRSIEATEFAFILERSPNAI